MLMMCWFYCIPFAKFLFYAFPFLLFGFALFMLKRGVYAHRRGLRRAAFAFMFAAAFKAFLIDVRLVKRDLLCGRDAPLPVLPCTRAGMAAADFAGLFLFVLACAGIYMLWRAWMPERRVEQARPEDIRLRLWANLAMLAVVGMIVWVSAPWVGYLTVGHVPGIFFEVPWHVFAVLCLGMILHGFWRAEACAWTYDYKKKGKMRHLNSSWTPRDTLWMTVFVYLIALGLSYAAHDVLTMRGTVALGR